ncbi:S-adenosyl-L-methionine-dependent methyltransferase [Chytriomyces sp. MP71]|nr:S-adenosyl-L-methionine-dependent methyltransferase [Chytriomyces sp. MP71]
MDSILEAAAASDIAKLKEILDATPESILIRHPESNASPLHFAAAAGSIETIEFLLHSGHPWNEVTNDHRTAAEWGMDKGHQDVWDRLLGEGIRAEMILALLGNHDVEYDDETKDKLVDAGQVDVSDYLNKKLTYTDGLLVDADGNAVMMGWEGPLMERHAKVIAAEPGKNVLNVGFGLGLIDTFLQDLKPSKHTIIEAHPDVYAKMIADGWDKKPGVRILFGKWQDVTDQLETYDGIFFDTFGEDYDALKEFHELLPNILSETGTYSYFNGLAGTNIFFHEVSCAVAEADLLDMGIGTRIEKIDIGELGDEEWQGTRRKYWSLPVYNLPICNFQV